MRAMAKDFAYFDALLRYDPKTGHLWWKTTGKRKNIFKPAGTIDGDGYIQFQFEGRNYRGHRIAWLLFYGEWPKNEIDHDNRIKSDNRILNLKDSTHSDNQKNHPVRKTSKSGIKGVRLHRSGKWQARVNEKHLGLFLTAAEAEQARERYLA